MASDKIFVDLDEEIVFTVEKVLESPLKRAIVVIPESANLVASLVSLKLLSRQIAKTDKTIVIVTEDSLGLKLANKAGLMAKRKISEITPAVWAKAEELKEKFLKRRNRIKHELITERSESDNANLNESDEYKILDKASETEDKLDKKDKEIEKKLENIGYKPIVAPKPRLEPKVVKLGNIVVLAGGDIEQNKKFLNEIKDSVVQKAGKIEKQNTDTTSIKATDSTQENVINGNTNQDSNILSKKSAPGVEKKSSIIGKDVSTIFTNKSVNRMNRDFTQFHKSRHSSSQMINKFYLKIKSFYSSGNKQIKVLASLAFVLILFYMFFVRSSSAKVDIYLEKMNVSINETITGKVAVSDVRLEELVVPIKQIKIPMQSSSNSADTTGKVENGEKARGLVTFYNKTEQAINLAQGTILENINSGLKYKLLESVDIPPAVIDGGGNVNVGVKKDVSIEAESFGEKYNITQSASYKISGFTTDQLSAKSFTNISGGTTVKEDAVSQEDIDNLKNGLIEELKNTLKNNLEQLISEDEIILNGTLNFNDPQVSSDKQVNEKADIVNVTVSLDATAYVVNKKDLKKIMAYIIERDSKIDVNVNENDLKDPVISDIEVGKDEVKFTISSSGNVIAGFDENEIKKNIANKSIKQAEEYLSNLSGVDKYNLSVSPIFLPSMLKKVPSKNKIIVVIHQ